VRYRRPYLGSKFFAGTFDGRYLDCQDQAGITMREAIRTFTGKRQPLSARPPDPRSYLDTSKFISNKAPSSNNEISRSGL